MGRTTKRIGLTQRGSDEGGSTSRTSAQIEKDSRNKRTFQYKKNDRGKIIKIALKGGGMNKRKLKKYAKKKGLPIPLILSIKGKKNKMLTGGQANLDAKDLAVLKHEKAKGRGMGLQDESIQPGKVKPVKAVLGIAAMGLLGAKMLKDKKKKDIMIPGLGAAALLTKKKKEILGKKSGGVMKYKRGSGLDLPVISSVKPAVHKTKRAQNLAKMKIQFNKQRSRAGKISTKGLSKPLTSKNFTKASGPFSSMAEMRKAKGFKPGESASEFNKRRKMLAGAAKVASKTTIGKIALGVGAAGVAASQYLKSKMNKKKKSRKDTLRSTQEMISRLKKFDTAKKMGGGMMQKPIGYSTGGPSAGFKSKEDRKKAEKNIKEARSKEGLRSFLSSGNKINQPMRKERYMEGRKARHTEFKRKIGKRALGIASSINPVTGAIKNIKNLFSKVNKNTAGTGGGKRDFQKGDYGDISVKKNMGGMMQKPMGYKYGTSVTAKCKLGRNKPTKIT